MHNNFLSHLFFMGIICRPSYGFSNLQQVAFHRGSNTNNNSLNKMLLRRYQHNSQHTSLAVGTTSSPTTNFTDSSSSSSSTISSKDSSDSLFGAAEQFEQELAAASAGHPSVIDVRGGEAAAVASPEPVAALTVVDSLASFWGSFGVVYILMKAIVRVVPIALEPFAKTETTIALTPFQLGAYITTCAFFAYAEGYKGFQTKFAPLVVARSRTIRPAAARWSQLHHTILAPLYSMGLFHATKKRTIVSWSVSIGVATIVAAVKKLPYPWRNIVDAGVVVGLSWGAASIAFGFLRATLSGGKSVVMDPALPVRR